MKKGVYNKSFSSGQAGIPARADIKDAGELARRKIYAGIPDDDVALALAICQKYGFDPLLKHLVLIAGNIKDENTGQWTKRYNAYVTRDGLLHVAHTSGMLDGLEVTLGKDDLGEWAEAAAYRKDMSRPFRYRVYLSEYAQEPRGAWKTHPQAMLTKTAEVFALRRAFDVTLTPIEEMGIEETGVSIPVDEAGLEARPYSEVSQAAAKRNTSEIHWLDDEPVGGVETLAADTQPIPAKGQEQTTPYLPADHSPDQSPDQPPELPGETRQTMTKQTAVNSNRRISPNGGQRRRLF